MPPLIILLAFAAYSVLHSTLASHAAKELARRQVGKTAAARGYRLFFNIVGVVTLLPVLALVLWLPDQPFFEAPPALRPLLLAGQVVGVLLLAFALRQTDPLDFAGLRQLTDQGTQPQLVTKGAYRWMRHPLYTGSLLVLWLFPSFSLNMFAFLVGVTLYFIIGARYEERRLEAFFGQSYREYKARTPMFIPTLKAITHINVKNTNKK